MPQVIIEQPGVAPITIPLAGAEIHLGRAEGNTVVLVADEVSRHHAKMIRRGDKTVLYDLNSLNGTYVNRQRIVERVLSHLDEVFLGSKCRIVFRDDTSFGASPGTPKEENRDSSVLIKGLDKIREEMDRAGQNLTLFSRVSRTPAPASAEPTPVVPAEELASMGQAYRRLSALYQASKLIASNFDLSRRLADVLDTAIEVMDAERGFVMLHDDQTGNLEVKVAREMGQELHASAPSMGIAGRAAIDGEPVLMTSADSDARFSGRESIIRQRIISAMCVPLRAESRILGSIYVDTRKPGVTFSEEDLELFASLASQSALAIDNVRLYEQMLEAEKKR
ncbi:MAG: GAF domain-containing protein, partial [Candidatus Hydrogenedentes bacterium]|nr:GAF domain-containing protein [Candidatus Hydrogenedentota bacterium]